MGIRLEFELLPPMFDTSPVVCTVKPHSYCNAAAILVVGLQGPGNEQHIRNRIPTLAYLERSIASAWLDSLREVASE